jgi:hypothetical protein
VFTIYGLKLTIYRDFGRFGSIIMKSLTLNITRKLLAALLTLTIVQGAFGQTTAAKKPADESVEFKKEAAAFLRETAGDVNNLRTAENRISFSAEIAALMWYQDEKEARGMFQSVVGEYRQLVSMYDSQLTQLDVDPSDGSRYGLFGGEDTVKAKLNRKFRAAMAVRQQIASSVAEHDPQLAFDFYLDSLDGIANPERRKQYEMQDKYFETRLLNQIADKDAVKAAEVARKSIKNGVDYQHLEILRKIYNKDADKGAEFADAITSKLKDSSDYDDTYVLGSFLRMGVENFEKVKGERGKKPMFSEQNLRDLSELLAQRFLNDTEKRGGDPTAYINTIEKFAPARAGQLRSRFGRGEEETGSGVGMGRGYAVNANTMPPKVSSSYTMANSNSATLPGESAADRARADKMKAEEEVMGNVMKLGKKELPKEERDKIVTQARKIVSDMDSPDQKIVALSLLAGQVAKAGDKELASDIMKEASILINPQPKNYKDYMLVWMLASGYAEADPEKAFPLIESAIFRLNDVISGTVKVAEFIDTAGEIVDDGEVQVGAFGGSMVRELTGNLGMVNGTLRSLAKADIVKTKALTNSFDRPEVRVLAKMLVLRALMNTDAKNELEIEGVSADLK